MQRYKTAKLWSDYIQIISKTKASVSYRVGETYTWQKENSHDGEVKPTNCL